MEIKSHSEIRFQKWKDKVFQKHDDKYDLSSIDPKTFTLTGQYTVRCKKHNKFFKIRPNDFIHYQGCLDCYRENTHIGTEEFIRRAKLVHGDKYDYSKVKYEKSNIPVTIMCPIHGEFQQRPRNHEAGQNCPKCAHGAPPEGRTQEYTEELKQKHLKMLRDEHPEYVFENSEYRGYKIPMKILCPKHSYFYKSPANMLRNNKNKCKKCMRDSEENRNKYIEKAKKVHGDKYDYSKLSLLDEKPTFICKIHNIEFQQELRNHLRYDGCPMCVKNKQSLTKEEFIRKAKEIYGELYDYSKVDYKNSYTNVTIICRQHGEFQKLPYDHLRGYYNKDLGILKGGCPNCVLGWPEQIFKRVLDGEGIDCAQQYKFKGFDYRFDFFLAGEDILIEIDDDSHRKGDIATIIRDNAKNEIARINGLTLIRIPYYDKNPTIFVSTIRTKLKNNIRWKVGDCVFVNKLKFLKYLNLPFETKSEDLEKYRFKLIKD